MQQNGTLNKQINKQINLPMLKAFLFSCLLLLAFASERQDKALLGISSSKINEKAIKDYKLHLVDIHWLSGDLNKQYIAHHFCGFPHDGFMICELFNNDDHRGRPVGVEYFITKPLFEGLPEEEKKLWHSHPYEILSGLFVVLDVTPEEEQRVLEFIMGTYGKVIDTWQYYKAMPVGAPQLGYALTLDSQVDWDIADRMDKQLGLSTTHKERRAARAHMKMPEKAPGADAYLDTKQTPQYIIETLEMKDVETRDGSLIKKVIGKVEKMIEEL